MTHPTPYRTLLHLRYLHCMESTVSALYLHCMESTDLGQQEAVVSDVAQLQPERVFDALDQ